MTATVLQFVPTPAPKDGGRARIKARRIEIGLGAQNFRWPPAEPIYDSRCDLTQDHADQEDTAPAKHSGDSA